MLLKIKTLNNRSKLLLILVFVFIISVIGVLLVTQTHKDNQTKPQQITKNSTTDGTSLQPANDEEKQQVAANKEKIVADQERLKNKPATGEQKTKIYPVISLLQQNGQQIEVGGYITGLFEEGGACITTFSQNGITFTRQAASVREGNSTYCPMISVNVAEFNRKATWNVVLSYDSVLASGSSDKKEIEVK